MARPKVDPSARKKQQSAHYARTDEAFYEQVKAENGGELPADLVGPDGQPRKLTQGPEDAQYRKKWRVCAAGQQGGDAPTKPVGAASQPCANELGRTSDKDVKKKDWIEIVCVYDGDPEKPLAYADVRVTVPNEPEFDDCLRGSGFLRISGIDPGTCDFTLVDVDGASIQ